MESEHLTCTHIHDEIKGKAWKVPQNIIESAVKSYLCRRSAEDWFSPLPDGACAKWSFEWGETDNGRMYVEVRQEKKQSGDSEDRVAENGDG